MKKRSNHIKSTIFVIIALLMILSGCGRKVNGSYILSLKEVKEHKVESIEVTFYNPDNRIESPSAILSSKEEKELNHIQSFIDILKKSEELSDEEEKIFSPPSQSTHRIVVTYDNKYILEFYYYSDNNWLIWSNTTERDGKKILKYYFLSPPHSSMEEWLSSVESDV